MFLNDTTRYKICPKCGKTKPHTDFSRDKRSSDGLQHRCKACERAYYEANKTKVLERRRAYYEANKEQQRAYSEANKEQIAERMRAWREANNAKIAEYKRIYRQANKTRIAKQKRAYNEANRERMNEQSLAWYRANKEQAAEQHRTWRKANPNRDRVRNQRRRIRKLQAEGTHTTEDIQRQYQAQKGRCYWCSAKVGDTYHVDHVIPLSRGGSNWPENLVIACPTCNISKGYKLPHEWIRGGRLL